MSAHDIHADAAHAHDGHDHHDDDGPHSTLSAYIIGFFMSVVLTAIPFWLVMAKVIETRGVALLALGAFAVVQIAVHMICFLHMDGKAEGGWTMLSTIFTGVFLAVTIIGTIWVMFHMNTNMMPGHDAHAATALAQPSGTVEPAASAAAAHDHGGGSRN